MPRVEVDTTGGTGRVKFKVRLDDPQRDYTGVLVTGPALPAQGRLLMNGDPNGSSVWPIEFSVEGVPAGMRTWVISTFYDIPGGRVMDVTNGRSVTVNVP
jgi:hypothetical protein